MSDVIFEPLGYGEIISRSKPIQSGSPGVYFLIDGATIVYVGQSINVPARVRQHQNDPQKTFDRVAVIDIAEEDLLETERYYIDLFRPKHNLRLGRPFEGKNRRPRNIMVSDEVYAMLERAGDGRAAEGLEIVARAYRQA
jgi:excinuclease UvrABC nuclease subunit